MAINQIPGASSGPTAVEIAAQVAAPSAATIASTVAAPSSSTIATAVAAAVPTIGAINSSVAANAPSPNAWTPVSTVAPNSTTGTYTFSNLSGYKAYKIVLANLTNSINANYGFRLNGDTGNNYGRAALWATNSATNWQAYDYSNNNNIIFISTNSVSKMTGSLTFNGASLTGYKNVNIDLAGGPSVQYTQGLGFWNNTDAITSITLFTNTGVFTSGGGMTLYGAN